MSRAPLDSGRYVPIVVNGHRQWTRDQVALRAEITELLKQRGGMPKKRIIMTLATAQAAIDLALAALLRGGAIERYRAMSVRRRLDEHWCLAGQTPGASVTANFVCYNAAATLAAMQQHAAIIHAGSAER
ncbi:hypothetical protein [Paraburkholderia sp. DGU8]|uniref:hypothetical protein n=1 Tax=Paraburkholderia sp. DGU8 TaxID=3161997 RepID=UPI0034657727